MSKPKKKIIFLDYASITPIDDRVRGEMQRIEKKFWGNPSSIHSFGEEAKVVLENARVSVAKNIHCKASEIYFTGGGTEALNISIFGVVKAYKNQKNIPHIILSSIEHPALMEPVRSLMKEGGVEVSFVNPDANGIIRPESIKRELKENTILVVVQHANNEIGTINPIRKIRAIIDDFIKNKKMKLGDKDANNKITFPYLLVDASQSVLYEDVSIERLGAHILVFDGIKMYGPRGVGVLFIKNEVLIEKVIFGGGQEGGIRPGTQNVPGIHGISVALDIAVKIREKESVRLRKLRDYFVNKIGEEFNGISLNGSLENRLPNNINICLGAPKPLAKAGLAKIDSEFLVIKLDTLGFALSNASTCHNIAMENSSYVIEAIGKKDCSNSSLRITLGRDTKKGDLDSLLKTLKNILNK
jgi:cysteine desulfurase